MGAVVGDGNLTRCMGAVMCAATVGVAGRTQPARYGARVARGRQRRWRRRRRRRRRQVGRERAAPAAAAGRAVGRMTLRGAGQGRGGRRVSRAGRSINGRLSGRRALCEADAEGACTGTGALGRRNGPTHEKVHRGGAVLVVLVDRLRARSPSSSSDLRARALRCRRARPRKLQGGRPKGGARGDARRQAALGDPAR